jgi:hypothetical protein
MAITFPLTDILTAVGFADQVFQPVPRQEYSRLASGVTIGKDFGSALWFATYVTDVMRNDDAVAYEALLDALDGVIQPFEAFDLRRPNPRLYTDGSASNGVLNTVNANNKALSLSGLHAGQVVSTGDYLSFDYAGNRALHRVQETVTANGSGLTVEFEVRPHLRAGWALSSAVNLKAPRGIFTLVPQSVTPKQASPPTFATLSFQAVQYLI